MNKVLYQDSIYQLKKCSTDPSVKLWSLLSLLIWLCLQCHKEDKVQMNATQVLRDLIMLHQETQRNSIVIYSLYA